MPDTAAPGERYRWLPDALTDGGQVLTGSRRLSRELRQAYGQRQMAAGCVAWDTPRIRFWQDWLTDLLSASDDPRARIGAASSTALWERCVQRSGEAASLPASRLDRQLSSAWRILQEWRIDADTLASTAGSADERTYARVTRAYQDELGRHGWIDEAAAMGLSVEQLGGRGLPPTVCLAGFDRITPLVDELCRTLVSANTTVDRIEPGEPPDAVPMQTYPDEEAEFRAAGRWARRVLEQRATASIAIVSVDLDKRAPRQTRLIREGLAPGWQLGGPDYARAVNVSYGRPFADFPLIAVALTCMRWLTNGLSSRDVSLLLRSPFVAGEDAPQRARLERVLRRLPDRHWTAAALADALEDASDRLGAMAWQQAVRRIAALQASDPMAPSAWAARIDHLLGDIGWPGPEALTSEDFQLAGRWRELLDEFASLDAVLPRISLADSVRRITALARETVYQPERGDGIVRLLGPLEAAGMEFDALWITGMDASRWPRPGGPLAFVSHRLQRERGMPDSTPLDSLEFSTRVIRRLLGSAPLVRMSRARTELDAELIATPILEELPVVSAADADDPGWFAENHLGRACAHTVEHDPVPPITAVESVAGGARVVAWQQSEPFLAFARGRLAVRELDRFQAGLPAWLRGELLHDALRDLYRDRPRQEQISAWSATERSERVDNAIRSAMIPAERFADALLRRLLAIERTRLADLIDAFLENEVAREPFRVERVEERATFHHAGVELTLRADRVDSLADGSSLIIDYKTGRTRSLLNRAREPVDPQVVVYAAAGDDDVGGLALFNVNRREIKISSTGPSGEWGRMDTDAWQAALARWKAQVFAALEAIAGGDVRVNVLLGDDYSWQLNVLSRIEEVRRDG